MSAPDYAFSDEPEFPPGWPELDFDEILLGEWVEHKAPASQAARRYRTLYERVEASLLDVRTSLMRDWRLYCAQPKGGVQ